MNKHGVTARDEREDKGGLEVRLGQKVGKEMALKMVDRYERHSG